MVVPLLDPVCEIDSQGNQEWKLGGLLHRVDGPAMINASGTKSWWQNGEKHRLDGPAIEWGEYREWWIFGWEYSEEDFNIAIDAINQRLEGKDMKIFSMEILKGMVESILTEEKEVFPV